MASVPETVSVVCVAVGDRYPMVYVERLANMLRRHMPVPYTLYVVVDRDRELPEGARAIDAREWGMRREGMRPTTYKLRLFESEVMPASEILYLDVTLVVHRDMGSLLEFAFGREEELVVVKDWNYDAYNTCVMRIRPGGALAAIPEAFRAGKAYDQRNPGDQDFVTHYVRENGLEGHVATFPPEMIASYRNARFVAQVDPKAAYDYLEAATIVKFYGRPKMLQLANPFYRFFKIRLARRVVGKKVGGRDAGFWVREMMERWR